MLKWQLLSLTRWTSITCFNFFPPLNCFSCHSRFSEELLFFPLKKDYRRSHALYVYYHLHLCWRTIAEPWKYVLDLCQAMLGRWMPLAVVYHKDYQSAKRTFLLYHQLSPARGIIYFLFLILPFFEVCEPALFE
jgi:hypothetical protein